MNLLIGKIVNNHHYFESNRFNSHLKQNYQTCSGVDKADNRPSAILEAGKPYVKVPRYGFFFCCEADCELFTLKVNQAETSRAHLSSLQNTHTVSIIPTEHFNHNITSLRALSHYIPTSFNPY